MSTGTELVVCGWDEVFILDPDRPEAGKLWSWRATQRPELPASVAARFATTDECKPAPGGLLLISSSRGAVALVDRRTGQTLWWAELPNAHSVEMLPGGLVVAAASVAEHGGNRFVLYDPASGTDELDSAPAISAHGLVWDQERRTLWGLCYGELHSYRLLDGKGTAPALSLQSKTDLPDENGHDLRAVPGTSFLALSTRSGCWYFDRDDMRFVAHPDLADVPHVKSMDVHPGTGRLAYIHGEDGQWWARHLRFLHPDAVLPLPDEHLYKARWWLDLGAIARPRTVARASEAAEGKEAERKDRGQPPMGR